MESSPIVRFDSTTVQTPPVHALLRSAHFGSSLLAALQSHSQVPLSDQCIGCFALYNCQTVLRLPTQDAQAYRAVPSLRSEASQEERVGADRGEHEPLVSLSFFVGLRSADVSATSDALDAQWGGPASSGKLVVIPFEWPRQNSSAQPHIMEYPTRIDLSWTTATECQIVVTAKQDVAPFSAQSFFQQWRAALISMEATSSIDATNDNGNEPAGQDFRLDTETRDRLRKAVESIQSHMAKGECYLANLTERIETKGTLRAQNLAQFLERWGREPSRFGWYLKMSEWGIESYSPERFFRIKGSEILTEPIKGTTPCLTNEPGEQQRAAGRLWRSEKERCEQHLVTDLLRNDFATVCIPGTIAVTSPMEIRFCSGLAQMTSVVRGQLRSEFNAPKILSKVLPAGSVTGAPKRAACGILQEWERVPRGLYCGVVADVRGPDAVEATLLIRSLFTEGNSTYACAGAGITTLSNAEDEVDEIETKLRSFLSRCSQ